MLPRTKMIIATSIFLLTLGIGADAVCSSDGVIRCTRQLLHDVANPDFCPIAVSYAKCISPELSSCTQAQRAAVQRILDDFNQKHKCTVRLTDGYLSSIVQISTEYTVLCTKAGAKCSIDAIKQCSGKIQQGPQFCPLVESYAECLRPHMISCATKDREAVKTRLENFNKLYNCSAHIRHEPSTAPTSTMPSSKPSSMMPASTTTDGDKNAGEKRSTASIIYTLCCIFSLYIPWISLWRR